MHIYIIGTSWIHQKGGYLEGNCPRPAWTLNGFSADTKKRWYMSWSAGCGAPKLMQLMVKQLPLPSVDLKWILCKCKKMTVYVMFWSLWGFKMNAFGGQ